MSEAIQAFAKRIRLEAFRMVFEAGDGHPGPAFSIADIMAVLYGSELNIDPKNPQWLDRDRFLLSKGHACPIWYACLSERGYFGEKVKHFDLRKYQSIFQGHPVMNKTPGVDMTSGSLGNGLSIGCGMSIAGKYQKKDYRTYVICGDGELQEGSVWEGVMIAAKHQLDNLVLIVDANGWQSGDSVQKVGGITTFTEKFAAFGWNSVEIDGHNVNEIQNALAIAKQTKNAPTAIIARCVKGKGLPFMENDNEWHKKVPSADQMAIANALLGGEQA